MASLASLFYHSTPGNTRATFDSKGAGWRWDCGHDTKLRGTYGETSEWPCISFSKGKVFGGISCGGIMMSTLPGHWTPRQSKIFRDLWGPTSKGTQCIVSSVSDVTTVSDGQNGILRDCCTSSWPQNSPGIYDHHTHMQQLQQDGTSHLLDLAAVTFCKSGFLFSWNTLSHDFWP